MCLQLARDATPKISYINVTANITCSHSFVIELIFIILREKSQNDNISLLVGDNKY